MEAASDRSLAHALLRITLGINICLHGVQRFPMWGAAWSAASTVFCRRRSSHRMRTPCRASRRRSARRSAASTTFSPLGYELTYFVLLATASWHRRSVAALIQRARTTASKRG